MADSPSPPSSPSSTLLPSPAASAPVRLRGLVFSKDRPLQLEALLASYQRRCLDAESYELCVLYTGSDARQTAAYQTLAREYPQVTFVREADFRADVLRLVAGCQLIMFLVDDTLFVEPFALTQVRAALGQHPDAIGFSLRLGRNTTYCYSLDGDQALPAFEAIGPEVLKYAWHGAALDFGYPLELSSSVYRTADIQPLLDALPFFHPNSLEEQIARATSVYEGVRPTLLCFSRSVAFSAPLNRVQSSHANRASADPASSPHALLTRFEQGDRIDVDAYAGLAPRACHQEITLRFVDYGSCLGLVEALLGEQKLDDAVEALEAFLARAVHHPAASHDLAVLYMAQDRTVDARNLLEAAVRAHPEAVLPRRALAEHRFGEGDRAGALAALRPLVAAPDADPDLRALHDKIAAWVPRPVTRDLIITVAP